MIQYIPQIIGLGVLLICSAFFSGSETALFSLTREDRRSMELRPTRSGRLILALLRDPQALLAAVLFGNMVVNITFYSLSFLVTLKLAEVSPVAAAISATGSVLLVILFGEVSPKGIAVGHPVRFSQWVAPILYVYCRATWPVSAVLRRIAQVLTRVLSAHARPAPYVTREELKTLMAMAEHHGTLDGDTRSMMEQVIEIASIRLSEVMTPRVDLTMFNLAAGGDAFCALVKKTHEDHIPAYEGSMDNVVGMLLSREVLLRPEPDLRELLRPVRFVPETQTVERLLRQFRETGDHAAIVVDEFGGTAGMVTLEHLLEEVVGEIRDEFTREETPIRAVDEDTYLLAGDLNTREWRQLLGVGFDPPGVETVAGFVISLLGRIPEEGDFVEWHGLKFGIEKMSGRRVVQVRVQRLKDEED